MLIAIGEVNMNSIIDGITYMAGNKGKVTSQMVEVLTDLEIKSLFLRKGNHHQDGLLIVLAVDEGGKAAELSTGGANFFVPFFGFLGLGGLVLGFCHCLRFLCPKEIIVLVRS